MFNKLKTSNTIKLLGKSIIAFPIYAICLYFIVISAFNYGLLRFFPAIPFIIGVLICSIFLKNIKLTILVIIISWIINVTIVSNSLVFSVIGSKVTFLKDGFIRVYEDGSGGFSAIDPQECRDTLDVNYSNHCGEMPGDIKVYSGQTTEVIGINLSYPDLGQKIGLMTKIGPLSQYDYKGIWNQNEREVSIESNIINENLQEYIMLLYSFILILTSLPWLNSFRKSKLD